MVRLAKNPTVNKVVGDQCMFGGEFVKPTMWLTNAPHLNILAKQCPGAPRHVHEKLVGLTRNFWGETVFKTSLAAEYLQGLCEELAKAYLLELEHHPVSKEVGQRKIARTLTRFQKLLTERRRMSSVLGG